MKPAIGLSARTIVSARQPSTSGIRSGSVLSIARDNAKLKQNFELQPSNGYLCCDARPRDLKLSITDLWMTAWEAFWSCTAATLSRHDVRCIGGANSNELVVLISLDVA